MATRKGAATGSSRSTTPASARAVREPAGPVRVWSEASITVAVTSNPAQFVKFVHGFEKLSKSQSKADLKRVEQEIYDTCEEIVHRRARKLARVIKRLNREYS